jgi:signal peptidase I
MEPTIMGIKKDSNGKKSVGDHILVNKLIYHLSAPRRGDVIVFKTNGIKYPPIIHGEYYVKRLVGLPGETISIEPPYIIVNGNKLTNPSIFQKITDRQDGYGGYCLAASSSTANSHLTSSSNKLILGSDDYLVLGDNSKNSLDGRYFGPIKQEAIVGKVFYIYAPADRKRRIE